MIESAPDAAPAIDAALVDRARRAAARVAPHAAATEAARRLAPEALAALVEAGVGKLLVPRELGGSEASALTLLAVIETIAAADGSAGWCAMIYGTSGLIAGFLAPDAAREVYAPAGAITCGVFAPMGRATAVDGGYRVTGRWRFASGCRDAGWCMVGALPEGAAPGPGAEVLSLLLPVADLRVHDTWDTGGLRGTGSHDVEADGAFVPAARAFSLIGGAHRLPGYRHAFFGTLAAGVATVGLGIARGALDAFVELARGKRGPGGARTLAERESAQLALAGAEARLAAARAFLHGAVAAAAREGATGEVAVATRARLRLAACHGATEAAAAIDQVRDAAGGAAVYATSGLERRFRDVHTATQHLMVGPATRALAGRILFGLDADASTL